LRIKAIICGIVLRPGESERWSTTKNDYVFIKSDGHAALGFNRTTAELPENTSGLFQCRYGSFTIRNNSKQPLHLQGIRFSCSMVMHKDFFTTDFEDAPFLFILDEKNVTEVQDSDIISILERTKQPEQPQDSSKGKIDPRLLHVHRFIRNNYISDLSLHDLANLIDVTPTYLSNTFTKVFNDSPIYYLNQLRMKKAIELLISKPDLTVINIATMVGYHSSSQFCSLFKRFHSKSPSQYREEMRKMNE